MMEPIEEEDEPRDPATEVAAAIGPLKQFFPASSPDAVAFVVTHAESPNAVFLRPLAVDAAWIAFAARVDRCGLSKGVLKRVLRSVVGTGPISR
jgi:hypothetical protein